MLFQENNSSSHHSVSWEDSVMHTDTHRIERLRLKTREIIMRSDIPKGNGVQIFTGGTILASPNASANYYPKRDINEGMLGNLQNTKDIIFSILDRETGEIQSLEIPIVLSERLGEYLRNRHKIETNEQYRLPGGLKNYPVNCQSFVFYIKNWFQNKPKLRFEYMKDEDSGKDVYPGDILYINTGDDASGYYWHYLIYLGDGFCISKNGHLGLVITRHYLKGLSKVIEK